MTACSDSDCASCKKTRKSVQDIVAQSTFESEFTALSEIVKQAKHVESLLVFMTIKVEKPIPVFL